MYCFNNLVVVDHNGLFTYVEAGFGGSFHDVRVLRATNLAQNWQNCLTTDDDSPHPVEYLLRDPGYLDMDHFILRRLDAREFADADTNPVVRAFNRRHAGHQIVIEWGIGGVKIKFAKLRDICTNQRSPFEILFRVACILTNFIHR